MLNSVHSQAIEVFHFGSGILFLSVLQTKPDVCANSVDTDEVYFISFGIIRQIVVYLKMEFYVCIR